VKLYPELLLKKENFLKFRRGWSVLGNQRKFFDEFARSKNFNPLDAKNWYSVTHNEIIRAGGSVLLDYYNNSHIEALMNLYPELKLKNRYFLKFKRRWKTPANQNHFFL